MEKTNEAKFNILFKDQKDILCVPRQSIRLFLPPWHDGLCEVLFLTFYLYFFFFRVFY
jgi:hypothetical protein